MYHKTPERIAAVRDALASLDPRRPITVLELEEMPGVAAAYDELKDSDSLRRNDLHDACRVLEALGLAARYPAGPDGNLYGPPTAVPPPTADPAPFPEDFPRFCANLLRVIAQHDGPVAFDAHPLRAALAGEFPEIPFPRGYYVACEIFAETGRLGRVNGPTGGQDLYQFVAGSKPVVTLPTDDDPRGRVDFPGLVQTIRDVIRSAGGRVSITQLYHDAQVRRAFRGAVHPGTVDQAVTTLVAAGALGREHDRNGDWFWAYDAPAKSKIPADYPLPGAADLRADGTPYRDGYRRHRDFPALVRNVAAEYAVTDRWLTANQVAAGLAHAFPSYGVMHSIRLTLEVQDACKALHAVDVLDRDVVHHRVYYTARRAG